MHPDEAEALPSIAAIGTAVTGCRACPRLVAWREQVAVEKRAAFADQTYWGRAVPASARQLRGS